MSGTQDSRCLAPEHITAVVELLKAEGWVTYFDVVATEQREPDELMSLVASGDVRHLSLGGWSTEFEGVTIPREIGLFHAGDLETAPHRPALRLV